MALLFESMGFSSTVIFGLNSFFVAKGRCLSRKIRYYRRVSILGLFVASQAWAIDCLIEPNQIVELASPVTGLLDKVTVKRGDRVSKGQIVAALESRAESYAADMSRFRSEQVGPTRLAEQKIEFSKRKFGRRQAMARERLLAVQESDDAEAELRLAESELKVAQENRQLARLEYQQQNSLLQLRTLRSPFDGVVVDQLAFPGEVVEPGSNKKSVVKLAQLDPLRIRAVLPRDTFGRVSVGMVAEIQPEIPAQSRYSAKIRSVDRLIDAASGTFVVILEMPNAKLEIPAGVRCKAVFPGVPGGNAKQVPEGQLKPR